MRDVCTVYVVFTEIKEFNIVFNFFVLYLLQKLFLQISTTRLQVNSFLTHFI